MTVRCGNGRVHDKATGPHHHETVAQVRLCFQRGDVPSIEEYVEEHLEEPEYDPDAAYERHLENLGHDEAMLQDQMEAAAGVVQWEDICVGGTCSTIDNLCSRHQSQYQARYGRASNE